MIGFLTALGNADDRFGEQFLFGNVALRGDSADFSDDVGSLLLHQGKSRSIEIEWIGTFARQNHIPHHLFDSNHGLFIHRNPLHHKHFLRK